MLILSTLEAARTAPHAEQLLHATLLMALRDAASAARFEPCQEWLQRWYFAPLQPGETRRGWFTLVPVPVGLWPAVTDLLQRCGDDVAPLSGYWSERERPTSHPLLGGRLIQHFCGHVLDWSFVLDTRPTSAHAVLVPLGSDLSPRSAGQMLATLAGDEHGALS